MKKRNGTQINKLSVLDYFYLTKQVNKNVIYKMRHLF